jgi:hypothetical protein
MQQHCYSPSFSYTSKHNLRIVVFETLSWLLLRFGAPCASLFLCTLAMERQLLAYALQYFLKP